MRQYLVRVEIEGIFAWHMTSFFCIKHVDIEDIKPLENGIGSQMSYCIDISMQAVSDSVRRRFRVWLWSRLHGMTLFSCHLV